MKKYIFIIASALAALQLNAGNVYKVSQFGIKSNGITDNTESIQKAVDFIHEKGGGELQFSVGRFITGAIDLKDNVTIRLGGGAVIVGSDNIYAYKGRKAIFNAVGCSNITIYGVGVIDGRAELIRKSYEEQKAKAHITDSTPLPTLLYFKDCKNVSLKKFILRNPTGYPVLYLNEESEVTEDGIYCDTPHK